PATRGEYTKRAFMNGKLSLSSAEGLSDMIYSESEGEIKAGYSLYREKLKNRIDEIQEGLTYSLAKIDADMDFPEEDLETVTRSEVENALTVAKNSLDELLSTYRTGRKIKNGVKVAICGKPNAGKSSILNKILNYDRAIVSSVAGTTRDVVEGTAEIDGIKFSFSDTAGIRETGDEIEAVGVSLALKTVDSADVVLFIIDGTSVGEEDYSIYEKIKNKPRVTVVNNNDLQVISDCTPFSPDMYVSALTGENVEGLKKALYAKTVGDGMDLNGEFLTEERHYYAIKRAVEKLNDALKAVKTEPMDLIAIDVKESWEALGEISGKTATEDVVDEIFSKFCVGK
ncbi:MAG: tRNA uridine-5-carboxymethylaminomethyl(34) synthesis GTPase MnmE, partial [Clostridia bacterium]|nr:tRNA uridine-5-carboxymethylaminomethyl(34) synthesis GTPase MnmE [Clostridia bacterium]